MDTFLALKNLWNRRHVNWRVGVSSGCGNESRVCRLMSVKYNFINTATQHARRPPHHSDRSSSSAVLGHVTSVSNGPVTLTATAYLLAAIMWRYGYCPQAQLVEYTEWNRMGTLPPALKDKHPCGSQTSFFFFRFFVLCHCTQPWLYSAPVLQMCIWIFTISVH